MNSQIASIIETYNLGSTQRLEFQLQLPHSARIHTFIKHDDDDLIIVYSFYKEAKDKLEARRFKVLCDGDQYLSWNANYINSLNFKGKILNFFEEIQG